MSIYYSLDKIKSYDRLFNFIIGGRGIGKTYACKKYGIDHFLKTGKQFIYLRRYKEEIKPLKNGKFFEAVASEFPGYIFRTNGDALQLAEEPPENGKPLWITCGYLINLSTALVRKSVDYSQVDMIIYDEFIIPKGYIKYLPNEVQSFLDFYETVARMREDVKVYFLSNSISSFNPYFTYFKIKPPSAGEFYKQKQLVVEMCKNEEFMEAKKQTKFGQLIDGTEYGRYAIDNEFYQDSPVFIADRSKKAKYYCTIIYSGKNIGIWVDYKEGKFYATKEYDGGYPIRYAVTDSDHGENILYTRLKKPVHIKNMVTAYGYGKMFFQNQEIKGYMVQILEMMR